MKSKILRFDANTLESKGEIKTVYGVRAITIDTARNLLLSGSLVTGMIDVIDLNTYQSVGKFYVGPWIRTITLDSENGIAYVSTKYQILRFKYID